MLYQKRIPRRGFLAGAAVAGGAAALVLIGCGGKSENAGLITPTGAAGQPKKGGTIHFYTLAPVLSLEPASVQGSAYANLLYSYVVQPTDWHAPDYIIGDLALSWETPDDVTWIFHLRDDAKFPDIAPTNGRTLVADDIVKSIDRLRTKPGVPPGWDEYTEKYEAVDARTWKETTKKPYGYFLYDLGGGATGIVATDLAESYGDDLSSKVAGSGPYTVKSYSQNEGLEVVRNPLYYHDYPYVDGFNFKVFTDDAAAQTAFRGRQIDAYSPPSKPTADNLRSVSGASITRFLDQEWSVFVVNAVKFPQFKDERIREAIDLSLNRQQMIDKLLFGDAELAGAVPPYWPAALPKEEVEAAYQRDVNKAKQLLTAANASDMTFDLSFASYQDNPDRAAIIQSNLADAGITVNLKGADVGTWLDALLKNDYVSTTYTQLRYGNDWVAVNWQHSCGYTHSEANYTGVDDPEVDALIDQINGTIDDQERIKLEQDMQRKVLARHGPMFTLYQPYDYWAAYDYVKGYTPTSNGFGLYKYDYWIDKS